MASEMFNNGVRDAGSPLFLFFSSPPYGSKFGAGQYCGYAQRFAAKPMPRAARISPLFFFLFLLRTITG